MPKFVFKLQPVLDLREREEQEKKRILADLERQGLSLESRIRQFQHNIENEQASLASMLTDKNGVDLKGARLQANAALSNRFAAQRTVLELAGVHKLINDARAQLTEASARRKAVELLKDRQREAFESEQRRRESLELDDMSVMRHSRRDGALL
ncbi:MAG: flagellar export protein FliJ [Phycisphaerales bacterium]|nr:flagellar export protein FliJ [Phycisphaerales bacterium]